MIRFAFSLNSNKQNKTVTNTKNNRLTIETVPNQVKFEMFLIMIAKKERDGK